MKKVAIRHPMLFALSGTAAFVLMLFASAALGALLPGEGYTSLGGLLGRLISSAVLVGLLARLGWLRPAGLAAPGSGRVWLLLPLPLAYAILASAFALTGRLSLADFGPAPAGVVIAFIAAAAWMEGLAFRGLILHALACAWGGRAAGGIRSVIAAALFFGGLHLLDALSGRPVINVLLQSVQAGLLGVWLGALVLRTGSLYPAIAFHVVFNLAGYQLFGRHGLEPEPAAWLLLGALMLPLAARVLGSWASRCSERRIGQRLPACPPASPPDPGTASTFRLMTLHPAGGYCVKQ